MPRSEQRQAALHLCLALILWVACVFVWVAALSFHVADPPSTSAWPQNSPVRNLCGTVGAYVAHAAFYYFGYGAYALLVLITGGLAAWTRRMPMSDFGLRLVGLGLVVVVVSSLSTLLLVPSDAQLVSGPGGILGIASAGFLRTHLQFGGTLITLLAGLIVGLLLAADQIVIFFAQRATAAGRRGGAVLLRGGGTVLSSASAAVSQGVARLGTRLAPAGPGIPARGGSGDRSHDEVPRTARRSSNPAAREAPPIPAPATNADDTEDDDAQWMQAAADAATMAADDDDSRNGPVSDDDATSESTRLDETQPGESNDDDERGSKSPRSSPNLAKVTTLGGTPQTPAKSLAARPARIGNYELPSVTLLDDPEPTDKDAVESLCREKAYILEQTLNEFRLEVQVVGIETGPVITVFELKLSPGVKVSQIASLNNDMARALKAPAVRVVAPLPGKNTIGIEVPNIDKEKVRLKDLLRSVGQRAEGYAIPLFLGKDASGAPLIADLTKMPHLLIAGTTGSGKSVCVGSIIMSTLLTRTPDEVNLVLVDPKVVELAMFKDIPHLICPIVTEMSKAEGILDWAATKMDERYELLAEAGVKDIRSYNKLGRDVLRERMQITSDEEMERIPVTLPYIVIVIDELADLMMTSAKEVEFYLCRLAQKSRAVGIHLIVSTQRPQANVVTGLIKSNLPSRIAFRVSSRLDSRIVLDQNGGEVLMGQGDMLFLPPGQSKLVRAQGTYISDEELRALVDHSRKQGEPNYHPELMRMPKLGADGAEERDELFDQAVDIMLETGRGSVSLLQRRLTIGYSRASRLVEQMYVSGIVGEYKGSQAREVLLSKEEWQALKAQRDRETAAEEAE